MREMTFLPMANMNSSGSSTCEQQKVLRSAVAKVVRLAEQVGVGPDQMIQLLEEGLTVRELLEYLVSRRREAV